MNTKRNPSKQFSIHFYRLSSCETPSFDFYASFICIKQKGVWVLIFFFPIATVRRAELPQIGETVQVSSLGRKATVLRVDQSKDEIVVQAGNMKLKLNLGILRLEW